MGGSIPRFIRLLVLGTFTRFDGRFHDDANSPRALTGVPIAGEIIHRCHGEYWGLIAFAGCAYAAGLICFIWAKVLQKRLERKV